VGAIKCDTLNDIQKKTMNDGAIKFVKYNELKCYYNESDYILENLDKIVEDLSTVDYPIDGYVIEVTQKQYGVDDIRKELGNTNHHYKWQIAYKIQGEKKKTTVLDITWQTGRGGNITPVLEIDPVFVSGANISRVTAHNYGYLKNKKIGIGSEIEIIRSGEVIPKIIGLVSNPVDVEYVYQCPVCKEKTILVNDIIKCTNFECNAQIVGRLEHFFKTLKIDLFGEKAIQILVDNGHTKLKNILKLNKNDFIDMGFGEKQSENFEKSINYALLEQYEDWKILASISIPLLGKGDSKKFLKQHYLGEIFDLKIEDIIKIDGFAEKKANAIIEGLRRNEEVLFNLIKNFNIIDSKSEISGSNVLNGNTFVFTGKMEKAREEMMKLCELNGGISLSSITKKTNYLVMGENVGKTKIDKATKYGTITITEKEFMDMLN
jgi:DNA ligase (NAD+)